MRQLIVVSFALIVACDPLSEGRDLTHAETEAYFETHADDLRHVIALVEACRPVYPRQGIYNAIRLNDSTGSNPACVDGDANRMEEIKAAIRGVDALQADIRLDEKGVATYAGFSLYAAGLGVSGVGVDVIYFSDASEIPQPPYEDGYQLEPLGAEPHRWFRRRWAT